MSFPVRVLRVVAIIAIAAGLLLLVFWLIGAKQEALSDATQRLAEGSPLRLQPYIDDLWGRLMATALGAMLAPLLLAIFFLFNVERVPPAGDDMAAAQGRSWTILLLVVWLAVGGIVFYALLRNEIAELIAPGLGLKCLLVTEIFATAGYYFATALGVDAPSRPSVPGASVMLRRR